MPHIKYVTKNFRPDTLDLISKIVAIVQDYKAQGYSLTVRQTYYQLVSKEIIPNNEKSYKRVGRIISDARRAGMLDWEMIEDRTRHLKQKAHWGSPASMVRAALNSYAEDLWALHTYRPMIVVEKEALAEVVERVGRREDVHWFSARGYPSDSSVWRYAQMCIEHLDDSQEPVVLHIGDLDPSGYFMTEDLVKRISMFTGQPVRVERLALNIDQVHDLNLVPNDARMIDSRAPAFVKLFGDKSYELDALEPKVIEEVLTERITELRAEDQEAWDDAVTREAESKAALRAMLKGL